MRHAQVHPLVDIDYRIRVVANVLVAGIAGSVFYERGVPVRGAVRAAAPGGGAT